MVDFKYYFNVQYSMSFLASRFFFYLPDDLDFRTSEAYFVHNK